MAYCINSGAARVPGNARVIGPAIADHDYATNGHTLNFGHLRAARACWPGLWSGPFTRSLRGHWDVTPLAKIVHRLHRRSICCPHFRGLFPGSRSRSSSQLQLMNGQVREVTDRELPRLTSWVKGGWTDKSSTGTGPLMQNGTVPGQV